MKTLVSPNGDSGKFVTIVREFPSVWRGRILDVGCRSQQLKQVLPQQTKEYLGVDLSPPADVVANLGVGLPLDEGYSDTVVALDVLEHTDDIYRSFSELCRVSQKYVLIALPNLYEITIRKRVLFGQEISGKYGLPIIPPKDRHRWIFSFREAEIFTHAMAKKCGFEVAEEACLIGRRRNVMGMRNLVNVFPNLLSQSYVALLERRRVTCRPGIEKDDATLL